MSGGAYRDRVFRPGDVRRILRRAAEIQDEGEGVGAEAGRPQTLDELTSTATDAGISDAALQRALADDGAKALATKSKGWSWTGAPGRVVVERNVNVALTKQSHAKLVKVMRKAMGEIGNAQAFGDSLSWSTLPRPSGAGRDIHAIVEPGEQGTIVRIEESLTALRGALFGGVLAGVGFGMIGVIIPLVKAISPHLIPFALPLWGLLVYAIVRSLYASRFRKREVEVRQLADTLIAELSAAPRVEADAQVAKARVAEAPRSVASPEDEDDEVDGRPAQAAKR
jgi:hypothetical protein